MREAMSPSSQMGPLATAGTRLVRAVAQLLLATYSPTIWNTTRLNFSPLASAIADAVDGLTGVPRAAAAGAAIRRAYLAYRNGATLEKIAAAAQGLAVLGEAKGVSASGRVCTKSV